MFVEEIRRALAGTPRERLAELSAAVWKGFACGAVSEEDAQQLAEEIAARKAVVTLQRLDGVTLQSRNAGSRPRSPASMERRRAWSAGSWMPPAIQARFTMGEAAAMAVILREIALRGSCELHVGALAALAGVSETTVRNARRQAAVLGLVAVEVRRVAYDRNMPNRITLLSRELVLWLRTRARIEGQGWVQKGAADPHSFISYLSSAAATEHAKANRLARGTGSGLPRPRSFAIARGLAPRRPRAPQDSFQDGLV